MPSAERSLDRGTRRADRILRLLGDEVRDARIAAGLSQRSVAVAARISIAQVSRIERAGLPNLSIRDAAVVASVVGLDLAARTYPGGDPLRDTAQARKVGELLRHVGRPLRYQTEVLLPPRDGVPERRRWDVFITDGITEVGVEVEMRLHDAQAQTGRIRSKALGGGVARVLIVVADTRHNRRVLKEFPEYFADWPRLRTASVLATLERGELPPTGLILF
jgi:transcriptional regulator with XRE-family HTH domain